jgi:hypothetical protein
LAAISSIISLVDIGCPVSSRTLTAASRAPGFLALASFGLRRGFWPVAFGACFALADADFVVFLAVMTFLLVVRGFVTLYRDYRDATAVSYLRSRRTSREFNCLL